MSLNEHPHSRINYHDNIQLSKPENRSRLMDSHLQDHLSTISEEKSEILQRPLSAKPFVSRKRDVLSPRSESKSKKTKFVNEFQTVLAKINSNQTRELGMREAQKMILSNQTPQALRIYLSSLSDHHQKQTLNSGSREMVVLLLGYIVSLYKTNLIDPMDQAPDLIKTVVRISETVHGHFKDETPSVQQACARTLNELYTSCLGGCDLQTVSLIMVDPLLSILNGGADRISQQTAAVCLCEFLHLAVKNGARDLLVYVSDKIYQLYLKTSHEFVELIRSIGICLSIARLKNLPERFFHLINRLSSSIRRNIPQPNVSYQVKIECCNVIAIIARIFKRNKASIPGDLSLIYNRVDEMLRDLSKHKIYKVQQAGTEALKAWHDLNRNEELPNSYPTGLGLEVGAEEEDLPIEPFHHKIGVGPMHHSPDFDEPVKEVTPKSYKSMRDQLKKEKKQDLSKNKEENQVRDSRDLKAVIEKNINDYLQNAVVGSNKTQDFVKSRSGNGGGYAGRSAENQIEKRPSYEMQKRHIKDLVLGKKSLVHDPLSVNDPNSTVGTNRDDFFAKNPVLKKFETGAGNVLLGKVELAPKKSRKVYADPDEREPDYFEGIKISTQDNGVTSVGLTPQRDTQKVEIPMKRARQAVQVLHNVHPPVQSSSPEKHSQLPVYEQRASEEHSRRQYSKPAQRYAEGYASDSQTFGAGSQTFGTHSPQQIPTETKSNVRIIHQEPVEQGHTEEIHTHIPERNYHQPAQMHERTETEDADSDHHYEKEISDDESVDNNLVQAPQTSKKNFVREPQFKELGWYPSLVDNQSQPNLNQPIFNPAISDNQQSMNFKIEKHEDEVIEAKKIDHKVVATEKSNFATRKLMELGRQMRPQTANPSSSQYQAVFRNEGHHLLQNQVNTQPIKKTEIHPPQLYGTGSYTHPTDEHAIEPTQKVSPRTGVRFAGHPPHENLPHIRLNDLPKEQQEYFLPVINKYLSQAINPEPSQPKQILEKPQPSLLEERPIRPMSQQLYQQFMEPVHQPNELPQHQQHPLNESWDDETFESKRKPKLAHGGSKLDDTMLWETMTSTEIRQKFNDIPVYEPSPQLHADNQTDQEPHKRQVRPPQVHPIIERKIEKKEPRQIREPSPVRTKLIPQEDVSTLDIWHQALEKVKQGDMETAYRNILATGDDVYLVRLLNITGPCLKKLQPRTTVALVKQLTKIMKSGFIEKLSINFLESSGKNGVTYGLHPTEQQTLFSTLYKLSSSSSAVGKKSAQLYTELRSK